VRRRIVVGLRVAFVLLVVCFLGYQIWRVRDGVGDSLRTVGLGTALLAGTLTFLGGLPSLFGWRMLLTGLGTRLEFPVAVRIYFLAGLTRYLPAGAVAPVVAQAALARPLREPPGRFAAAAVLTQGLGVLAGLVVSLLVLPQLTGATAAWWLLPPVLLTALLPLAIPRLLAWLLDTAQRLLRRGRGEPWRLPDRRTLLIAISLMTGGWLISGSHVVLLATALGADPRAAVTVGLGGYALSVLAGGAAIVLPRGLGAKEVVLGLTLATLLTGPALVTVVALSRVLAVVFEAATSAVVLGILSLLPGAALAPRVSTGRQL
jgi:uncharacterized membrane protein YbhN (UPF0104 family)